MRPLGKSLMPERQSEPFIQRHQTRLILAVFVVVFAAAMAIQWRQLRQEARDLAHGNAQHLAEVFQEHLEEGRYLHDLLDRIEDPGVYDLLLKRARYHLQGLGLEKVKFYDPEGG